ncbi:MAG: hypothetical protein EBR28_11250 [Planctomycetia bacterium]|nr:hypothetical protein [Planctomycetia bacterium]
MLGVVAATAAWLAAIDTPSIAAPPNSPFSGKRLFDAFTKKPAPQAFIPAPTPPPLPEQTEPATAGAVRPPRLGQLPQEPVPAPVQIPTWEETLAFARSLKLSADRVAEAAGDPDYHPKPKPQRSPLTSAATKAAPQVQAKPKPAATQAPAKARASAGREGSGPQPPQTKRFARLRSLITNTLATYQRRPLNTANNTPWEVMHGFVAFGIPTKLRVGGPTGDLVNAIGWMNTGGRCRGQVMLAAVDDRVVAQKGIGVQGHSAQYLAILAQCRVALNSPISIQSKSFTVADLVEEEKRSCRANSELTFALIGLAHYLPTDADWESHDGKKWNLEKLVAEEIEQPIRGAPCGGTHRLFGLAYGCQRRLRATGKLDGHYARADKFVRDYQQFTLTKLQNPDGSFSTEWFKYPADRDDDIDRKVQTTGHILEWLVGSLDQEDLYHSRVVAAAEFLATALAREPSRTWKIGPMGHALHALTIYQERAWGTVLPGGIAAFHGPMKAATDASRVARKPTPSRDKPVVR